MNVALRPVARADSLFGIEKTRICFLLVIIQVTSFGMINERK